MTPEIHKVLFHHINALARIHWNLVMPHDRKFWVAIDYSEAYPLHPIKPVVLRTIFHE